MSLGTLRRNVILSASAAALLMLLSASAAHHPPQPASRGAIANPLVLTIDPAQSTVHYTISSSLHTVHGTFAVKQGLLRVDPSGTATGEIVVDAASGKSGNNSRDHKMHKEVLESARFTDIVFRADRVEGAVEPQGSSRSQLHGKIILHGAEHEFTVPVEAELGAGQWKGTAQFTIPYVDWGLKNPSNFLLKVDRSVRIEVDLAGTTQSALER